MAYGTKYILDFTNNLGEDYHIEFRLKNYVGDSDVIVGTDGALQIKSFNSDDDIFAPILSKEALIEIHAAHNENLSITDFLAIEDDDWNIVVYRQQDQPPIFNGFLLVEDSSQPLHDRPYQLRLRVSDGLPLLKNVELKQIDGSDFNGLNAITDYLGGILYYVNPEIPFKCYYDVFHKEMDGDRSPLEQIQVDAKTFEKDEITYKDSYTCLEMILRDLQCRLFFENGFWHIVSLWQYRNDYGYTPTVYTFGNGAVTGEAQPNETWKAKIGKQEVIYPINKDAVIYYKVANKSVKKTFTYDIPKEIVCNQQLLRGERLDGLSGEFNEAISAECWTQSRVAAKEEGVISRQTYINREFDLYKYELDRYLVNPTQGNDYRTSYLHSTHFPVGNRDKVSVSVETRLKDGYTTTEVSVIFSVLLRGEDGSFWSIDNAGVWGENAPNFITGTRNIIHTFETTDDKKEWVTVSVDSEPIPVPGDIQVILWERSTGSYPNETWYKNIQIEYLPYIKDSYRPVSGDYNLFSQNLKINRTIDEQVSISDSPKKIIKGSLFVNNTLASPEWYRKNFTESLRFTQIMALIKYNFTFRQYQKIEGTLKGVSLFDSSEVNIPFGFLPQYYFSDITGQPTTVYILTSMDVNYVTGQWRGVLVSVQLNGAEIFDNYDFTYLF